MTLDESRVLLSSKGIPFEEQEFQNEGEYRRHFGTFCDTANTSECKVIAIIIRSKNGHKDIELQFKAFGDSFYFHELYFGTFFYEMFDCTEDMLAEDLIHNISEIMEGNLKIIVANNLKYRNVFSHARFDLSDEDDAFGKAGYEKAMQRIQKPKGFFERLLGSKKQYEIYDWNSYQCIVR